MPKDLPIRDQIVAYLTVEGWTIDEIATAINVMPESIRLKLTDERIIEKQKALSYKLFSEDTDKRLKDILPRALDVLCEILEDTTAKPQIKISAAQDVIDRVLGKPKQTVEHQGSLVRAMLEKLNASPEEAIAVDFTEVSSENKLLANPNEARPSPDVRANPNFQEDPVDSWIKKNLKQ